jgi:LuxR family transcriptional regulator, maltose regulon positive regulatory protein
MTEPSIARPSIPKASQMRGCRAGARLLPAGVFDLGIEREGLREPDMPAGGFVLLEAPAGFGKTRLLAQWYVGAQRTRCTVAWVTLNATQRSPAILGQELLLAFAEGGVVDLPSPEMGDGSGQEFDIAGFSAALTASLAKHRRRILLVLDDYQTIEQSLSDELLSAISELLPNNLVIALATRRTCPIALSRILLQRRLRRLEGEALLFSKAESRIFFEGSLRAAQINRLHWLTAGWPAALEMARMCLSEWRDTTIDIHNIPEYSRLINDYCGTEILRYVSPAAVELLLECSITETLEPELCNAIRQRDDSAEILATLTAHEKFMGRVDLQANTWRLPRLLGMAIARRAATRGSHFLALRHLRAAAHFESTGETLRALQHYLHANKPDSAAAALERRSPLLIAVMQGDTNAGALLDLIPPAQIRSLPRLGVCRMYLDFKQGLIEESRTLMTELANRTDNFTTDRPGGCDLQLKVESICVELIMESYRSSRVPLEYLEFVDRQMSLVSRGDPRLVKVVHLVLGGLYKARGDLETAQTHYIQVDKLNKKNGSSWTTLWLNYHFGSLAMARGQLIEGKHHVHAGLKLWAADYQFYAAYRAMAQIALAEINYETNALTEAQRRLDEALYTARHVEGWFEPYAAVYEIKMMIHWHAGELDKVESLLASTVAIQRVGDLLESFLHALKLRLELLRGRVPEAQAIVETHGLRDKWMGPKFQDDFAYREWDLIGLCLCLIAIQTGSFLEATQFVDRLYQVARLAGRGRAMTKATVLRAIIAQQQGNEVQGVIQLVAALEMGHSQGYHRVFTDEADLVRPLFVALMSQKQNVPVHLVSYAQKLNSYLIRKGKPGESEADCGLSERERNILREVSKGHSNKLIARKFGLSAPTVNFHLRNVFQKLGVHRRASATAEAYRRGWLS